MLCKKEWGARVLVGWIKVIFEPRHVQSEGYLVQECFIQRVSERKAPAVGRWLSCSRSVWLEQRVIGDGVKGIMEARGKQIIKSL